MKSERMQNAIAAIQKAGRALSRAEIGKAINVDGKALDNLLYNGVARERLSKAKGSDGAYVYSVASSSTTDAGTEKKARAKPRRASKRVKTLKRKSSARRARALKATIEPTEAPVANGRRFGYFSDGSLLIECAGCKGTLTQADLVGLRDFVERFEKPEQPVTHRR